MKQVQRQEILPLGEYEAIRPHFRGRIIEQKKDRRVSLGDRMSAVFENHDTVLLQIQEMLRTERITREDGIAHELATYNELLGGDDELSLTLFIEVPDKVEREAMLEACAGMENHVFLELDGERIPARALDRDGAEANRTTAVQYYRVPLGAHAERLRGKAVAAALLVDHPAYRARAELSPKTLAEIAGDLRWS